MEEVTVKKLKEQHINTYRNAVLENINNNTSVLVDEDFMSLFRKPPLDSMDLIKSKFLSLAKKNKIVLNTEKLSKMLDDYRKSICGCCTDIKKLRISKLSDKVYEVKFKKDTDTIKINKKDFNDINKEIKAIIKNSLLESYEKKILKNINSIFLDDVSDIDRDKIINEISKYIKGNYQKQLLESIDIKILVKDTTLINNVKEQTDRYLFTLNNSRMFDDNLID